VYKLEDHLAPQTMNFTRSFLGVERTMKMNRYVHIEDKGEMKWLASHFSIDLSIRANSSGEVGEVLIWDDESIAIVQNLFRRDFETFGYDRTRPDISVNGVSHIRQ
jgi:hypothetical protein